MSVPADLRPDCGACLALCCVALPFARSADFAFAKPAGEPCRNLRGDLRCGVHAELRPLGMIGCTVFDCFGAGQQVSQVSYPGFDPASGSVSGSGSGSGSVSGSRWSSEMFEVFAVMRQLHEMLWYLADASRRPAAASWHPRLGEETAGLRAVTSEPPPVLLGFDVPARRRRIGSLLELVSAQVRGALPGRQGPDRRGADLIGKRLRDARGASLRGAHLIGADLTGADLHSADLLGADLRGAHLSGADLSNALFLTQDQVNSAHGSPTTTLDDTLHRPTHWT